MKRQQDDAAEVAEAREALAEAVESGAELLAEVASVVPEAEPVYGLAGARPGANAQPAVEPAKGKE